VVLDDSGIYRAVIEGISSIEPRRIAETDAIYVVVVQRSNKSVTHHHYHICMPA
jgi:hypothetical protein